MGHDVEIDDGIVKAQTVYVYTREGVSRDVVFTAYVTYVWRKLRHKIEMPYLSWWMTVWLRFQGVWQGLVIGEKREISSFQ